MISIVYNTRKTNDDYRKHLESKSGLKDIEIFEVINNGEQSLSSVYNECISKAKYSIVICLHDDLILPDNYGKTLVRNFQNYPDAALIGLAGNTDIGVDSCWYSQDIRHRMVGQVKHTKDGRTWLSKYCNGMGEKLLEVAVIDGLFMAFNKNNCGIAPCDEDSEKFHFYDVMTCLKLKSEGKKIYVCTNILVTHLSVGEMPADWEIGRKKSVEKYGSILPIKIKPEKPLFDVVNKKIKKEPRVNIIILSKDRNDLLFKCIDSIYKNIKYNNFRIIVADTGSKPEVLDEIVDKYGFVSVSSGKEIYNEKLWFDNGKINSKYKRIFRGKYIYIPSPLTNQNRFIHLIEYDYYNFAQINNDVVKNHIDTDCDLLLFCNNDIELVEGNDALTQMVDEYLTTNNAGCIGARLHYPDNSIQHSGVISVFNNKEKKILFGHHGINTYYIYHQNTMRDILGVTGAFLMIKKDVFIKCGMFNGSYSSAFEDVELNIKSILSGRVNILVGNAVLYHAESQTRTKSPETLRAEHDDMVRILIPFVESNFKKLEKYITKI